MLTVWIAQDGNGAFFCYSHTPVWDPNDQCWHKRSLAQTAVPEKVFSKWFEALGIDNWRKQVLNTKEPHLMKFELDI